MILHRHLKALLHRLGIDTGQPPDEDRWLALLVLLNDRFRQFEEERHRLQRSLDIHSREVQQLYKELTLERDKVSSALACLDSAFLLLDAQAQPLLMSAEGEYLLGYSEAEIEGKNLFQLLGIASHLPSGGLTELLRGLRPVELEVSLQTRRGSLETRVELQPLLRERQLVGCLMRIADPQAPPPVVVHPPALLPAQVSPPLEAEPPAPPAAPPPAPVQSVLPPPPVAAPPVVESEVIPEESLETALAALEEVPTSATVEDLPATPPTPSMEGPPPLRILLVEADLTSAREMRDHLQGLGHYCHHINDAQDALRIYQESPFDAVMCSEHPNGFSGLELCKKLRQDTRGSYPYFILMTPAGSRGQATKALEAGIDAFLNKPFDPVELGVRLKVARGVQSRLNRVYANLSPRTTS